MAAIRGTKAETVIAVLEKIPLNKRRSIREITLDLSSSMMLIALRWMARGIENEEIAHCRKDGIPYTPFRYANGDTRKQLLARVKYILTKHASKWTKSQQWRADIIFEFYPG